MRRLFLVLVGALALYVGGRALVHALASHETRIAWVIDDMVDGFNATRMNPILDGLDREFLDDTWGADRETVRAAAAHLFFNAVDGETKRFLYRAEWTLTSITVSDGPAPSAQVVLEASFFEKRGESEVLAWKVRVDGDMHLQPEGEWCFARTRTTTLEGEKPR
ncbi:MAG: hypothetical protein IT453_21545 [Planctomycetes bacterium]|nr:hypothetical protein [Planctomycetota bacterium]